MKTKTSSNYLRKVKTKNKTKKKKQSKLPRTNEIKKKRKKKKKKMSFFSRGKKWTKSNRKIFVSIFFSFF